MLILCYSMNMATKNTYSKTELQTTDAYDSRPLSGHRISRIAKGLGQGIGSLVANTMTLKSERAFVLAAEQMADPAKDTRSIDERIEAYLNAPMQDDDTHPDPMSPQFNLFGE